MPYRAQTDVCILEVCSVSRIVPASSPFGYDQARGSYQTEMHRGPKLDFERAVSDSRPCDCDQSVFLRHGKITPVFQPFGYDEPQVFISYRQQPMIL